MHKDAGRNCKIDEVRDEDRQVGETEKREGKGPQIGRITIQIKTAEGEKNTQEQKTSADQAKQPERKTASATSSHCV